MLIQSDSKLLTVKPQWKQGEKLIKIVVDDTQAIDKKHGKLTLIKTAGYIVEANLKDKFYIKIK